MDPYGNWVPAPPPGLPSLPGPPQADFRPASPDSFDDDYDDVSMAGSERGPPAKGVYLLAGAPGSSPLPAPHDPRAGSLGDRDPKPGDRDPKPGDRDPKPGDRDPKPGDRDPKPGNWDPKPGDRDPKRGDWDAEFGDAEPGVPGPGGRRCRCPRGALGAALALLGLGWAGSLALGIGKHQELRAELELLKWNFSGIWDSVQQDQTQLRSGMRQQQLEQQELAGLLCRSLGSPGRCGPGWLQLGPSCFSFSRDALSWGRARNACAELGARLAEVQSEEEQALVLQHSERSSSYWLGLRLRQRKWRWESGGEPGFIFWDVWRQEEQREPRECGALGPEGRWVGAACAAPLRWICQRPSSC